MNPAWMLARDSFPYFLKLCFGTWFPGKALGDNWHIHAIAHFITSLKPDEPGRRIITMPPRSLKSKTVSAAYPAYLLGQDPSCQIMVVSYGESLAEELSNLTRMIMEAPFYRAMFPNTRLIRSTNQLLVTDKGGQRFGTTMAGAATGIGADVLIIDDPHNANDISHASSRLGVIESFENALVTRLNDQTTGKIFIVMQRLHEEDLAGHLLAKGGWDHLKLPAKAEQDATYEIGPGKVHHVKAGDLLHVARLPQSALDDIRRSQGSARFEAQYQQNPVPVAGNIIRRDWLRYYDKVPDRSDAEIVLSLDTATKTDPAHDYSVCTVWQKREGSHHLIDLRREKLAYPDLRRMVTELWDLHRANHLLIEDTGTGSALITDLNRGRGIPAVGRKARDTKEARLSAASGPIEAGQLYLPKDAHWLAAFETELLTFPGAKHDDQVDSLSQYFGWVRDRPTAIFDCDWMRDDAFDHGLLGERLAMGGWR
jgi:predicted phage terminase large subunit-like protein